MVTIAICVSVCIVSTHVVMRCAVKCVYVIGVDIYGCVDGIVAYITVVYVDSGIDVTDVVMDVVACVDVTDVARVYYDYCW